MNCREKHAYNYLLSLGYAEKDIKFNKMASPDFITSDGKLWEVKPDMTLSIHNFTWKQLYCMPMDTIILLVNDGGVMNERLFQDVYGEMLGYERLMTHIDEMNKDDMEVRACRSELDAIQEIITKIKPQI